MVRLYQAIGGYIGLYRVLRGYLGIGIEITESFLIAMRSVSALEREDRCCLPVGTAAGV